MTSWVLITRSVDQVQINLGISNCNVVEQQSFKFNGAIMRVKRFMLLHKYFLNLLLRNSGDNL